MKAMSSTDVVEALGGRLSYRMLDYWCRTGAVFIEGDSKGSGDHRRFTPIEVQAISDLVDANEQARNLMESIRNGSLFEDRLRFWEAEEADLGLCS